VGCLIVILILSVAASKFYREWTYMGDHWNEAKLKPSDQKDMARECAELIASDARELRLDYRNMDILVDVLHYKTNQRLPEILKKVKSQWEVTSKTESYASLEWDGLTNPWRSGFHAAIWWTPEGVVVCRSCYYAPGKDPSILEKIKKHCPIALSEQLGSSPSH